MGENAIASFSFTGLMFPGGEMPARLICRPYFCQRKIAGLGLPVTYCQALKFPVVLLLVTAICRWYKCQRKTMACLEPSNLLLRRYLT